MIVLSPIEETGWDSVLEEAKEANIPVIIVDRNITTEKQDLYLTHIGSSFKAQGSRAGLYVTNHYHEKHKNRSKYLRYVVQRKHISHSLAIRRLFRNHRSRPRIHVRQVITGDYIRLKAKEQFSKAIDEGKLEGIDVIYSHNDEMTLGALDAVKEKSSKRIL